ncbi:MAG: hypothetical protein P8Q97_06510 [Myxococcota bacterium]|nr:hypothetical protein [Myxococcota bacterium]
MPHPILRAACWLPLFWVAWYIWGLDPSLPVFDQWDLALFYHDVWAGEAGWRSFLTPHNNSHPILFARLLLTPLALITDLDFKAEIWLCLGLVVALLVIMAKMLDRAEIGDRPAALIARFLSAFLLCSPVLYLAWSWSVGFFHFAIDLSVVAAACALIPKPGCPPRARNVLIAMLCCAIASTTRAEGLASWVIFAPSLFAYTKPSPQRIPWRLLWLSGFLLCTLLFVYSFAFLGKASSMPMPSADSMLDNFLLSNLIALGMLGRPLGIGLESLGPAGIPDPRLFMPFGVLLLTAFAWLSWSHFKAGFGAIRNVALAWVGVGSFALCFAGATSLVRGSILDSNLFGGLWPSMYSATSLLLLVATLQLAALRWPLTPNTSIGTFERRTMLGGALAVALLLIAGYGSATGPALSARERSLDSGDCWDLIPHLAEKNVCFLGLPPKSMLEKFERVGFRRVRNDVVKIDQAGDPSLGRLAPTATEHEGVLNREFNGWIRTPEPGQRPSIFIDIDGELVGQALPRQEGNDLWHFVGRMHWSGHGSSRARAYSYDRAEGLLRPLSGEVSLAPGPRGAQ